MKSKLVKKLGRVALCKMPKFYLISGCGKFVGTRSFYKVLGEPEVLRKHCVFPQNFHTRKPGEITAFYEA